MVRSRAMPGVSATIFSSYACDNYVYDINTEKGFMRVDHGDAPAFFLPQARAAAPS